jgi:uncharacterized repeat protein (TIGR03803 family)
VFSITSNGVFTTLYTLGYFSPSANLALGADGDLYGTTWYGGTFNEGSAFKVSPSGSLTVLYNFCSQSGCVDGKYPNSIIPGSDGNFYGTSVGTAYSIDNGSLYYVGATLFQLTPAGALTTLYSFCLNGCTTVNQDSGAPLVQDSNGTFYGTTQVGGAAGEGTVFSLQVPCSFNSTPSSLYLDATAQSFQIAVAASGPACAWSSSTNSPFVSITSGGWGSGNGTVTLSVAANATGADLNGTVTIAGQTISVTQRANAQIFADVAPSAYYFDFVNLMATDGITGGCQTSPAEYCPDASVTRGEMAVFLVVSAMGASSFNYDPTPYFTDVPESNEYFKFIQKLKELGITAGCSATEFCPDDSVTRDEMAAFVIRARYETTPFSYPSAPYFTDEPATDPFFPFVQKLAQMGITGGCAPELYCPTETLPRGQMAVFIATGLLDQLLPAGTAYVASASPNTGSAGQTVSVALTGVNTNFVQGSTQVTAAPGISISNITVTSPTTLTVQLAISAGMAANPTSLIVTTGTQEADLPNGFVVQ